MTFTVVPCGGPLFLCGGEPRYRYEYSVFNDGQGSLGAGAVQLFDIFFDTTLYDKLSVVTPDPPASTWDEMILGAVPGIFPAYDALARPGTGGIPVGATVSGFAVQFTWLGGASGPGSQPFEIDDPDSFIGLESGTTAPQQAAAVPEPGTLVLLSLGLLSLAWWRVKRWHRPA